MNLSDHQICFLRSHGFTERNPTKKRLYSKTDKNGNIIYVDCRYDTLKVYGFDRDDKSYEPFIKSQIIQQLKAMDGKQMKILGGVFEK